MEFISNASPIATTTNQSTTTHPSIPNANMTVDASLSLNGNSKLGQDQQRFQVQGSQKPLASPLDTSNTLNHNNCQQSGLTLYQHSTTNESKSLNNESIHIYDNSICKSLAKSPTIHQNIIDTKDMSSPLDDCPQPAKSSAQLIEQIDQNNSQLNYDVAETDIRQVLSQILEEVEKIGGFLEIQSNVQLDPKNLIEHSITTNATATIPTCQKTSITPESLLNDIGFGDGFDDLPDDRNKDIVTLKNLEISPPPPLVIDETASNLNDDKPSDSTNSANSSDKSNSTNNRSNKRSREDSMDSKSSLNQSTESNSRSKRQRTQTKLYQAEIPSENKPNKPSPAPSPVKTRSRQPYKPAKSQSTSSSSAQPVVASHDLEPTSASTSSLLCATQHSQDVIHYEKYDYLAIRNEENTFYLCQLLENVKLESANIKIKWLDTNDGGKTYHLTQHHDIIPQKSILMPVELVKLHPDKKAKVKQIFVLEDQHREVINDRLKRSLIANSLGQGGN